MQTMTISPGTQSYREWLVLAFARRVVSGLATEYECIFMRAFMKMELSERNLREDCVAANNLTAICNDIEEGDCSTFVALHATSYAGNVPPWKVYVDQSTSQTSTPSEQQMGGE